MRIGPVYIRTSSRNLSKWGHPRIRVGGLNVWSWTNTGGLMLASYSGFPTWRWAVSIDRRIGTSFGSRFGPIYRERMMELYEEGNSYVPRPRWWHRFLQLDRRRQGQWHDYLRLPFGFELIVGWQDYHRRRS